MLASSWTYHLVSLGGILALCLLAWLSGGCRRVGWRGLGWGLGLQLAMGALVFSLPAGRQALWWINGAVTALLGHARAGIEFVFGRLALPPGAVGPGGETSLGFILAIQALPTIIFFMALTALLYQLGILQRVVRFLALIFTRTLGTSGAESLGVASNIFVGVESAGMVRPFIPDLTRSEFFCLLTSCMATVASSTLGVYVMALKDLFPGIAGHLVSASLISAPAAVVVAKLMEPETGSPLTAGRVVDPSVGRYGGVMEAITQGSLDGAKLMMGVIALLISFLGLASLLGGLVSWLSGLAGQPQVTLGWLLGWAGWPLALIMGVPVEDARAVGQLLGQRALVTEIPAYMELARLLGSGGLIHGRSAILASYALCGFAHVGSVAIFVGGYGVLAPGRLGELSRLGLKALWAATLATLMTGCVAGVFCQAGDWLLQR